MTDQDDIRQGLYASSWRRRRSAIRGIAEAGTEADSEAIARCLRDRHEEVRIAAAEALGSLGYVRVVPHLLEVVHMDSEDFSVRRAALLALVEIGPDASDHVAGVIADPGLDGSLRGDAVAALERLGDAGAPRPGPATD